MGRIHVLFLVTILLFPATEGAAQDQPTPAMPPGIELPRPGEIQELLLRDGTRAYGRVDRVDGGTVTFTTTAGAVIEVSVSDVVSVRRVEGRLVSGEFYREDPNPTRLFFAPTGRSLRRGEGYFGVYEILLPFVQVGITDRISFGAGTPLVFGADSGHPVWITPKVQVLSVRNTDAAVGVMHFLNVGDGSFGIAYAVVTQGNTDSAVTGGIGYAYERYGGNDGSMVAMIGGEHRVSRGLKLISENYVWRGGGIATGGVRFLGERLSVDLGLLVPLGTDEPIAFPMVNFVWKITRK